MIRVCIYCLFFLHTCYTCTYIPTYIVFSFVVLLLRNVSLSQILNSCRRRGANRRLECVPCIGCVQVWMPSYFWTPQTFAVIAPLRTSSLDSTCCSLDIILHWFMVVWCCAWVWYDVRMYVLGLKFACSSELRKKLAGSEVFQRSQWDWVLVLPLWRTGLWQEWSGSKSFARLDQSNNVGQHCGGRLQVGIL